MRKRSRMDNLGFGEKEIDDVLLEKGNDRTVLYFPGIKPTPLCTRNLGCS